MNERRQLSLTVKKGKFRMSHFHKYVDMQRKVEHKNIFESGQRRYWRAT